MMVTGSWNGVGNHALDVYFKDSAHDEVIESLTDFMESLDGGLVMETTAVKAEQPTAPAEVAPISPETKKSPWPEVTQWTYSGDAGRGEVVMEGSLADGSGFIRARLKLNPGGGMKELTLRRMIGGRPIDFSEKEQDAYEFYRRAVVKAVGPKTGEATSDLREFARSGMPETKETTAEAKPAETAALPPPPPPSSVAPRDELADFGGGRFEVPQDEPPATTKGTIMDQLITDRNAANERARQAMRASVTEAYRAVQAAETTPPPPTPLPAEVPPSATPYDELADVGGGRFEVPTDLPAGPSKGAILDQRDVDYNAANERDRQEMRKRIGEAYGVMQVETFEPIATPLPGEKPLPVQPQRERRIPNQEQGPEGERQKQRKKEMGTLWGTVKKTAASTLASVLGVKGFIDLPTYGIQRAKVRGVAGYGGLKGKTSELLDFVTEKKGEKKSASSNDKSHKEFRRELKNQFDAIEKTIEKNMPVGDRAAMRSALANVMWEFRKSPEAIAQMKQRMLETVRAKNTELPKGAGVSPMEQEVARILNIPEGDAKRLALRQDAIKEAVDRYGTTKVSGMQAIRETVNTASVALGHLAFRGAAYMALSPFERRQRLEQELAKSNLENDLAAKRVAWRGENPDAAPKPEDIKWKNVILGGIKETMYEALGLDAKARESGIKSTKTKTRRAIDAVRAWGVILRTAGVGASAFSYSRALASESTDKLLAAAEQQGFFETWYKTEGQIFDRLIHPFGLGRSSAPETPAPAEHTATPTATETTTTTSTSTPTGTAAEVATQTSTISPTATPTMHSNIDPHLPQGVRHEVGEGRAAAHDAALEATPGYENGVGGTSVHEGMEGARLEPAVFHPDGAPAFETHHVMAGDAPIEAPQTIFVKKGDSPLKILESLYKNPENARALGYSRDLNDHKALGDFAKEATTHATRLYVADTLKDLHKANANHSSELYQYLVAHKQTKVLKEAEALWNRATKGVENKDDVGEIEKALSSLSKKDFNHVLHDLAPNLIHEGDRFRVTHGTNGNIENIFIQDAQGHSVFGHIPEHAPHTAAAADLHWQAGAEGKPDAATIDHNLLSNLPRGAHAVAHLDGDGHPDRIDVTDAMGQTYSFHGTDVSDFGSAVDVREANSMPQLLNSVNEQIGRLRSTGTMVEGPVETHVGTHAAGSTHTVHARGHAARTETPAVEHTNAPAPIPEIAQVDVRLLDGTSHMPLSVDHFLGINKDGDVLWYDGGNTQLRELPEGITIQPGDYTTHEFIPRLVDQHNAINVNIIHGGEAYHGDVYIDINGQAMFEAQPIVLGGPRETMTLDEAVARMVDGHQATGEVANQLGVSGGTASATIEMQPGVEGETTATEIATPAGTTAAEIIPVGTPSGTAAAEIIPVGAPAGTAAAEVIPVGAPAGTTAAEIIPIGASTGTTAVTIPETGHPVVDINDINNPPIET